MSEKQAHIVALLISIVGPLLNIILGFRQPEGPPYMYLYWLVCLVIYIVILMPFIRKSPLTLVKLIPFGLVVEDFFSNMWRSLFEGSGFLPFNNWYTEHFPFLGSFGESTPYLLIPRWYFLGFFVYFLIGYLQRK